MVNIFYMGIARVANKSILADYAPADTRDNPKRQFSAKVDKVLNSGRLEQHARLTITDKDVGTIHYEIDSALLFMVIAERSYPQRLAFALISEAHAEFEQHFSTELSQAHASGLTKAAKPFFKRLCDKYDDAANVDKLASVALQVDQVKGVMQNNIQNVLKNQENLETLLDSSDTMRNQASVFNCSTNQVKDRMRWKNMKLTIAIILLLVIIGLVIGLPVLLRGTEKKTTPA